MAKNVSVILDASKLKTATRKAPTPYKPFKYLDNRITPEARKITQQLFLAAQEELGKTVFDVNVYTLNLLKVAAPALGEIVFDVDAGTKAMVQAVNDSGIRFGINKFMNSVFQ